MTAVSVSGFTTRALLSTCEREVYHLNARNVYRKSTVLPVALM
jgi:hypothetical protein